MAEKLPMFLFMIKNGKVAILIKLLLWLQVQWDVFHLNHSENSDPFYRQGWKPSIFIPKVYSRMKTLHFIIVSCWFRSVCSSVHLLHVHPYFHFWAITSINVNGFSSNLVHICMCIDIMEIWFGIADGQIFQFLTELSAHRTIMVVFNFFSKGW